MRVGITGASGQLGQALMRRYPQAIAIGHRLPDDPVDVLIHAACPNWTVDRSVTDFYRFNLAVMQYQRRWQPKVVNVGSWWQVAVGSCRYLTYTRLKDYQQALFPDAVHVVAYSIYGPSKGFSRVISDHVTGRRPMPSVGTAWRDFIHVDDVATAVEKAIDLPPGRYSACTAEPVRLDAVASAFGINVPTENLEPRADLRYPLERIPLITRRLSDHIAHDLAENARREWDKQRTDWRAA